MELGKEYLGNRVSRGMGGACWGIQRTKLERPVGSLLSSDNIGQELFRTRPSRRQQELIEQINR